MHRHGARWIGALLCLVVMGTAMAQDASVSRRERARLEREARQAAREAEAAAQAEAKRLASPSPIEGQTIEVFESQRPVDLPLPAIFDERTSLEDVFRHALLVAREEAAQGLISSGISLEQRAHYITWHWQPALEDLQQRIRENQQRREQRSAWQVEQAGISARWDQEQEEAERAHRLERLRSRHDILLPVLSEEERIELDFLVEDMRRRQR